MTTDFMTTINCSSNCKYQHDGKCSLDSAAVSIGSITAENDCVFFEEKPTKSV